MNPPLKTTNNAGKASVSDILDRIKMRRDSPSKGVHQLPDKPTTFQILPHIEEGQTALRFLIETVQDASVEMTPGSSFVYVTFNEPSQAAYFKLKYCD